MRAFRWTFPLGILLSLSAALVLLIVLVRIVGDAQLGFLAMRDAVMAVWLLGSLIVVALTTVTAWQALRRTSDARVLSVVAVAAILLASPLLLILLDRPSH